MTHHRMPWKDFLAQRQAVLDAWPTGRDVADIEDGLRYQRSLPADKNFAKAMAKAKAEGRTLIQPRAGVAMIDEVSDNWDESKMLPDTKVTLDVLAAIR